MAKRKREETTEKSAAGTTASGPVQQPKAGDAKAPAGRRKRVARPRPSAPAATAEISGIHTAGEARLETILGEIRGVKDMVQALARPVGGDGADAALESAVSALRRLLSDLIEQRMEAVVRELVEVRRLAAAAAQPKGADIIERLDHVLESLGAVRFAAEPMDVVDPLIHAVIEEGRQADAPDGVILATVRPGFRTARGLVLCQAAVAVNRRP